MKICPTCDAKFENDDSPFCTECGTKLIDDPSASLDSLVDGLASLTSAQPDQQTVTPAQPAPTSSPSSQPDRPSQQSSPPQSAIEQGAGSPIRQEQPATRQTQQPLPEQDLKQPSVKKPKNKVLAFLLCIFFGPLGLLYVSATHSFIFLAVIFGSALVGGNSESGGLVDNICMLLFFLTLLYGPFKAYKLADSPPSA